MALAGPGLRGLARALTLWLWMGHCAAGVAADAPARLAGMPGVSAEEAVAPGERPRLAPAQQGFGLVLLASVLPALVGGICIFFGWRIGHGIDRARFDRRNAAGEEAAAGDAALARLHAREQLYRLVARALCAIGVVLTVLAVGAGVLMLLVGP